MHECGLRNESSVAWRIWSWRICRALSPSKSMADWTSGDAEPICSARELPAPSCVWSAACAEQTTKTLQHQIHAPRLLMFTPFSKGYDNYRQSSVVRERFVMVVGVSMMNGLCR